MRTRFFDLPLRFQILIPFSLLIILLTAAVVGFGLPLAKEVASDDAGLKLDNARSSFVRALDERAGQLEADASLVGGSAEVHTALAEGSATALARALEPWRSSGVDALQVTAADGRTLGALGGHTPLAADGIAALAPSGRGIITSTAGAMLVAVQPIGPPETPAGLVVAGRLLTRVLPALAVPPGTEVAVYQDGALVATTFTDNHGRAPELSSLPAGLDQQSGPVKKGSVIGGHAYSAAYDSIPLGESGGAAFAVFVPRGGGWPVETLIAGGLAATLAVALILLILGFATARAIAARLERVVHAIERIGGGDFEQRVHLESSDEVGRLARMVNRMAARLQEAETSKAEFLGMASHELKTPLALIQNATELLVDQADGDQTQRAEMLGIIGGNVERMKRRVADLLDLARLEAGRLTLNKRPLDLGPLLSEVAEGMRPMLAPGKQTLSVELPAALPQVSADPDRIQQVLLNLLTNAARHTAPGTRIALRARLNGHGVIVEVEDDGPGLPDEKLRRLLDAGRRPFGGEGGLGLIIAQRLIALHNGRVWARSESGRGSLFAFALPAAADKR